MTDKASPAIVAHMELAWFALYGLGAAVALYGIVVVGLHLLAAITDKSEVGSMRFVGGETIIVPRKPERPRKRWRITVERV